MSFKENQVQSARNTLWYITLLGFAFNYMFTVNLNIAIVDMVQPNTQLKKHVIDAQCFKDNSSVLNNHYEMIDGKNVTINDEGTHKSIKNKTNMNYSLERMLFKKMKINVENEGFKWDEYQQGLVLGSFFWLHWLTQIPGGILARKYGAKKVFGLSNLLSYLICFLMPICSYWDYRALIFLRVLQGLICGVAWPAIANMTAQWIPPNERSKFVTAYFGSSIGVAVFYPFFGYIISIISWEWVFHISGIIGIIWFVFWHFLVYDSPALHPRISLLEREYIERSLGRKIQTKKLNIPWKAILTDRAVWMIVIAQFGNVWGLYTFMTQAPTYFKYIHGWNIKMSGFLSGLPHIMKILFAYSFSIFGDYLLTNNKMSRTNVRKLAGFVSLIISGFLSFGLAYSGCNAIAAIVFLTLATASQGAISTGPMVNIVDLSPNYASVIMGISGTIGVIPGFISPIIVGILTYENQTMTQWKYIFLIGTFLTFVAGILYVIFGNAELKIWNNPNMISEKILPVITINDTLIINEITNGNGKCREGEEKIIGIKENSTLLG